MIAAVVMAFVVVMSEVMKTLAAMRMMTVDDGGCRGSSGKDIYDL